MWVKLLLLFFVFSFLFKTDHSFNQDLGRHLKLGEIIWQSKSIPKLNLFSYTYPDFPFINTHWLFEVWVYLTSAIFGLQVLLIAKIVIILLSVWLVLKTIPDKNPLLLPIGFIFLYTLRERPELRPEIFSFLFTAATYYILEKFEQRAKLIFLLPFIQFLWINTHIYFFVGLGLQAIFLIHSTYQYLRRNLGGYKLKLLAVVFGLSVAASLINPHGLTGFLYPVNVTKNYGYTIVENQTMFLLESINFQNPNFKWVKICLIVVAFSLLFSGLRKKFSPKNILLACFGSTLALLNVRGFPYLIFVCFPAVIANFGSFENRLWKSSLVIIFVPIMLLSGFVNLSKGGGLKFEENAKEAIDCVLTNNLAQPIFNNFDIGSYIIYRSYPKYRVFVDGRPEAYPKEFFQNIYIPTQSDYSKFKDLEKEFGFQTIIFSVTDQTPWGRTFLASIIQDKNWKTVYSDGFMIVLVKTDLDLRKK